MRYFQLDNLPVKQYTLSPEIYALQIRTEDRTRWIVINYAYSFKWSDYSIQEAIETFLSDEYKEECYDSWYRAWCD